MTVNILLQLFFLATSFNSLDGAGCFLDGLSWTEDHLLDVTLHIPSASACLDICTLTSGCVAFTWLNQDHHPLAESCVTYSGIGEPETCDECTSGLLADCQTCSQPVGCQVISENLIDSVTASSEVECKNLCYDTIGCVYYTWYEKSPAFRNICFLLSSCEDTVDCTGCTSGPPQCFCKDIEFKLLDDPTRNAKHGGN